MAIPLNKEAIISALSEESLRCVNADAVSVLHETPSTQDALKELGFDVALVVAESQTSGRGRNGRAWSSQSGENILMSCSWVYSQPPKDLSGLSLALSVVLAEALYDEYGVEVNVKWPNDILVKGKKLAGILLDVSVGVACRITIGLGLNVEQSGGFDVDQPWTDLASQGLVDIDRNKLIAAIFSRWISLLKGYSELGFEPYKKRWCLLAEYINRKVILKHKSSGDLSPLIGVFKGVDDHGQLLIDVAGDLTMVSDSEYSMRAV